MTPPAIVRTAWDRGIAMIAICDHNSAGNVSAVQEAAAEDIIVLAGMEMTTAEEVHVVGLFPSAEAAGSAGDGIHASLPESKDPHCEPEEQLCMDAQGRVVNVEAKMLSAATALTLSDTVRHIRKHNGIAIAAHVDRPSFSVMSQLGLFPGDAGFDAIEVSAAAVRSSRVSEFDSFGLPVVTGSDAHFLSEIGKCCTLFEMFEPSFGELALALKGIDGRWCCCA
jgi:predicted metal-dependent phosphoesterase TrpH